MSVITTADKKIRKAKELMSEAYRELVRATDEDTWGYNDFEEGYINKVRKVMVKLIKLKKSIH